MRVNLIKFRFLLYILCLFIIYNIPLSYIEGTSFCVFYNLSDIECIGCGTTRAFFNFINFNFEEGFSYNKHAILWFIFFLFLVIQDIYIGTKYIFSKNKTKLSFIESIINTVIKL